MWAATMFALGCGGRAAGAAADAPNDGGSSAPVSSAPVDAGAAAVAPWKDVFVCAATLRGSAYGTSPTHPPPSLDDSRSFRLDTFSVTATADDDGVGPLLLSIDMPSAHHEVRFARNVRGSTGALYTEMVPYALMVICEREPTAPELVTTKGTGIVCDVLERATAGGAVTSQASLTLSVGEEPVTHDFAGWRS